MYNSSGHSNEGIRSSELEEDADQKPVLTGFFLFYVSDTCFVLGSLMRSRVEQAADVLRDADMFVVRECFCKDLIKFVNCHSSTNLSHFCFHFPHTDVLKLQLFSLIHALHRFILLFF